VSSPRCPYCLDDLLPDQDTVRCSRCRTPHHRPCFDEHAGCVAYGCLNQDNVQAGLSIFNKPSIHLRHQPSQRVALGPFGLGWKRLPPIREQRPDWRCPQAYARLSLQSRELREGQSVQGRAVLYVPADTTYRRIEIGIYQGIRRPSLVTRVHLTRPASLLEASHRLPAGSHPFYLELTAPLEVDPCDPYQLELVMVPRAFSVIRSGLLPVFLLQRQPGLPPNYSPVPSAGDIAPANIRVAVRPRDPGGSGLPGPPPEGPAGSGPSASAPVGAPVDSHPLPLNSLSGDAQPAGKPPGPADTGPARGDWEEVPLVESGNIYDSGERTGRVLRLRFAPAVHPDAERLDLRVPPIHGAARVPINVEGGGPLASLSLAVHYELVRPGGVEVEAEGFPATEEARLLGERGGLDPRRFGDENGLLLDLVVPSARLEALAKARAGEAKNAALRLRIGLDAISREGRVINVPTRTVTLSPDLNV
jgi:Prokaryotic RING finger family 1